MASKWLFIFVAKLSRYVIQLRNEFLFNLVQILFKFLIIRHDKTQNKCFVYDEIFDIIYTCLTAFRLNSEAYNRYLHFQSLQYQERSKRG